MEYRLNKIDTDLRQKINDATRDGLVHGTKNIAINKDKAKENKVKVYKLKQDNSKNKILVDAIKTKEIEVQAFKEKTDSNSVGAYIDTKK